MACKPPGNGGGVIRKTDPSSVTRLTAANSRPPMVRFEPRQPGTASTCLICLDPGNTPHFSLRAWWPFRSSVVVIYTDHGQAFLMDHLRQLELPMATATLHQIAGILCLFYCVGLLSFAAPASAERASLVADLDSGVVLHANNARLPSFPASLTKLMTSYLVLEALASNRISLQEDLTVSAEAARQPPVTLGLHPGWTITVEEMLLALILRSANDAAAVAAESLADSDAAFAEMMNTKAKELGMVDSVFRNASGLPHPEQVTTARDMAILAQALHQHFPQYFPLFSRRSFQYRGRTFNTHNSFLKGYRGAQGLKTGFTCYAGYNLVSVVERDGRRLIGVILGAHNAEERDAQTAKLLNDAFARDAREVASLTLASLVDASDQGAHEPPNADAIADSCTGKVEGVRVDDVSGWSLTVGTRKQPYQARALAARIIQRYRRQLKGGRPLAIPAFHGMLSYRAAITGLKRENSLAACRYMQKKQQYCMVMPPAVARTNVERGRSALTRARKLKQ
jgi:D-alanyl-D-alanine carboxypeptidase